MKAAGAALVTGAGRGLGRAIALELATRGFDVFGGVRSDAAAESLAAEVPRGASLRPVHLDVTELERFRVPDDLRVLVNNAGYRGPYLPVEETPRSEWRATFDTNFFGLVELTRAP